MSLKNNFGKKALAAITAASMMFAASGCGEYTSWAMKYGDYTANSGVFIYYQMEALDEAKSILQKENENIDLTDTKTLKTLKVEDVDLKTWVNNKAQEDLKVYLAVNQKFDELGLELSEDKKSEIDSYFQTRWISYGEKEKCEKNGTGEESYKSVIELSYKEKEVFTYYYGEGGELEYSDSDFRAYLEGNYARTKMVKLNLKDGAGSELDDEGKKEIRAMAEDYKKRALSGESMDDLIKEYTDYYNKLTEEAEAETTGETAEVTDSAVTTEALQTTTDAAQTEVTAAEAQATSEESQAEESVTEVSEQGEEPASTEENNAEVTTTADESNAEVTTTAEDSASDKPEVTTESASEGEEESTTGTDEETDPYANESILFKGSEEDGYNPSKVVNEAVFNECVVKGDPMIVEDEENLMIYVIQRLDILERTDFFEGDVRDYLLWEILEDDFRVLELGWIDESKLDINDKSMKRYDPFNIEG